MSLFQQPSQGDRVNISELLGSLVLFYVRQLRQGVLTSFGEREAIECDVHVLDGPSAGKSFENALIFQGGLIGSLRSAAGADPVLGRLSQGIAKPGQTAPYILSEFTGADAQIAEAWIAAHKPGVQQPSNGTAPKAAPAAAAATGSPAAASPASGNPPAAAATATVDLSALPPEVRALLEQTGAVTA